MVNLHLKKKQKKKLKNTEMKPAKETKLQFFVFESKALYKIMSKTDLDVERK